LLESQRKKTVVKKKLMVLAVMLAMLLVASAYAWPAEFYPMQISGEPSGDKLICFIPEGCDMNKDGVPDLRAGEPVPNQNVNTGFEQYRAF
jgi:hypothetical protein